VNAAQWAELLDAPRTGRGRYQAHCPGPMHARGDRSRGLSIAEGRDGRTLLHCHAGCPTKAILAAVKREMRDLFDGPPPSSAERAAFEEAREEREGARHRLHWLHSQGCERLHEMQDQIESLGARLMFMSDSPEADALTEEYHRLLDESRGLEAVLMRIERWF
jgi:hypothetical protein